MAHTSSGSMVGTGVACPTEGVSFPELPQEVLGQRDVGEQGRVLGVVVHVVVEDPCGLRRWRTRVLSTRTTEECTATSR